jgi:hypothetical protein
VAEAPKLPVPRSSRNHFFTILLVPWFINTVTYFSLREAHFPLTLAFSPIGGEGWGEGAISAVSVFMKSGS